MTTEIIVYNQWYDTLIDELSDLITETEFTSRWALIEGYHAVGTRIIQEQNERPVMSDFVQCISKSLQKSERTIYYAVQFAKTYPDLSLLPEGKDCSWFKVVNKYLTTGEKKVTITKGELMKQIEEIKKLLEHEWQMEHQESVDLGLGIGEVDVHKIKCKYIRYLQDQVNKIIGEDNES